LLHRKKSNIVPESSVQSDVPLAPYTTLGLGGNARYFVPVASEDELLSALVWAREQKVPVFLLGGGSNLVVADAGFSGLVVHNRLRGIRVVEQTDSQVVVEVAAGEDWDSFVRVCAESGWQGVECLAGIPGFVGGTPVQNVGAYGQEVAETIVRVRAVALSTGTVREFSHAECGFAYRRSRFNREELGQWAITAVRFQLNINHPALLKYTDLTRYFANRELTQIPSLLDVYEAVREIRSQKGMVVRPDDPDSRSAGSFFKNPIVSPETFQTVQEKFAGDVPHWLQDDGSVKLSAAWLIQNSGFVRGETLGGMGLSGKHILAIVNRGGGTASELNGLALRVQQRVADKWGVLLAPEPIFLGFTESEELPESAVLVGSSRS